MSNFRRNALTALAFLFTTSHAYAALVGETPAKFQVSPSGAATYSIPIQVPPGINGIQPDISLNYNSQGGNGLLGLGWNIGGLSAITRCPATYVQDSFKGGINFDSNDRFCLDGQRLLVVGTSGGTTEYRTAINTFSEIKSYGTAGNGPAYFIVRTKSGQIMRYGTRSTPDNEILSGNTQAPASRVEAQGKSDVLVWALSLIQDRNDNYLAISYAENNTNGESYPTEFLYTGNPTQGLIPNNRVQLEYEARTDPIVRYVGGSAVKTNKRISKINIYSGTSLVKEYQLAYTSGGITNTSHLTSITECMGSGNCLPPIALSWTISDKYTFTLTNAGPPTKIDGTSLKHANFSLSQIKFGDFNGDGLTDVYRIRGWGQNVPDMIYFSNGDGTFTTSATGPTTKIDGGSLSLAHFSINRLRFGDFNGDGLTDVYRINGWNENKPDTIFFSNGDGTFTNKTTGPTTKIDGRSLEYANFSIKRLMFGDFNGDGLTDVYRVNGWNENKPDTIFFSNGDGTFTSKTTGPTTKIDGRSLEYANFSINRLRLGDFNGDGLTDVYRVNGWNENKPDTIFFSNGDGTFTNKTIGPTTKIDGRSLEFANFSINRLKTGDFNGDGLTDIYRINGWDQAQADKIYFSNGDGTFTAKSSGPATHINGSSLRSAEYSINRLKFADFNGDGRTDVYRINGWDQFKPDTIYFSNGDGTFITSSNGPSTKIDGKSLEYANFSLNRIQFGDFNGDGMTDVYRNRGWNNNTTDVIYLNSATKQHVTNIANSLAVNTSITYTSLTNKNIYTKGTGTSYPERDAQYPMYVVERSAVDAGIGNQRITNYAYRGLKINLTGRGNLGFAGMELTDVTGGIRTSIDYRQDYPFVGMANHIEKRVISDNQLLSESDSTYAYKSPYTGDLLGPIAPYSSQSVEKTYELSSGQLLSTTTTTPSYDNYGNPITTNKEISGGGQTFSEVTTNAYYSIDTANWCLSMTSQSDVTITGADSSTISRTTTFGWDNTACRLTQSTILPGQGDSLEMTTVYSYDSFGNRTSEAVSGPVDAERTTVTDYASNNPNYPDGLFATSVTNTLLHSESREYDPKTGQITKLTGPNGIATCFEYDELGRQVVERQYCGTASETTTTTSYAWCDTTCPQYASYMVTTQQTGNAPVVVYYDKLNRELRKSAVGFSDQQIFVDTKYDDKGRVAESSEPYFNGDVSYWSVYTYDVVGRVTTLKPPHTTQLVTTSYNGFTTTVTDVKGRQRSETENAIGQTVSVTDALLNTITYQYDAGGNLTTTTDSAGNVITLTYDKRDRKITMSDPDMGNWSYTYNTFGELLTQTDAKTQTTTMQYDALGRMVSRNAAEGSNTWIYDTATNGIGKLARMDGAGGNAREFTYDALGRPNQVIDHIDMQAFTTSRTYDYAGRIDTITYPANFAVKRIYNFNGYLTQVQSTDGATVYWQADSMNARGQILDNTLGNGVHTSHSYNDATGWMDGIYSFNSAMATVQLNSYNFDDVGNLLSRSDQRQGLTESFTYDDLDRVLTADIAGGTGTYVPRSYSYDALGNITNKSDVGNYLYGQGSAGPHAVTQAGTGTYAYDANGNMVSGAGRTIGYTSFNKPNAITDGGTIVNFYYGADKSRIIKVVGSKRTIYVGLGAEGNALYEQETNGSVTKHRHYIYAAGSQAVAIHTNDGTTDSMEYLHRDHLGSVEAITDANGQVTERMSFDVWGKQRSVDWSDVPLGNYITNTTNLGFTGHENIPEVGYIHMNGRVYDPVIGRFLSADPNVQSDTNTQSYNRYTYVSNNPLRYTDPTGYFLDDLISSVSDFVSDYGTIIAAAYLSYVTGGLAAGWFSSAYTATAVGGYVAAATVGAVAGATFAASYVAMNGGNLDEVLQAAGQGAMTGAAHGIAGAVFGPTLAGKMTGAAAMAMASGGDIDSVMTAAATAGFMHYISTKLSQSNTSKTGTAQAQPTNKKTKTAYVGGAADNDSKIVKGAFLKSKNPGDEYFEWDEKERLAAWIDENKDYSLTVVGHSYGGDTAATVVAEGHHVDNLITVDPVGITRPDFSNVAKYSGTWTNYVSTGTSITFGNFVAFLGGAYNNTPQMYADYHNIVSLDHVEICRTYCSP